MVKVISAINTVADLDKLKVDLKDVCQLKQTIKSLCDQRAEKVKRKTGQFQQ